MSLFLIFGAVFFGLWALVALYFAGEWIGERIGWDGPVGGWVMLGFVWAAFLVALAASENIR